MASKAHLQDEKELERTVGSWVIVSLVKIILFNRNPDVGARERPAPLKLGKECVSWVAGMAGNLKHQQCQQWGLGKPSHGHGREAQPVHWAAILASGSWWQFGYKGFPLLSQSKGPAHEVCFIVEYIEVKLQSWKHVFLWGLNFAWLLILGYYLKKPYRYIQSTENMRYLSHLKLD